MPEKRRGPTVGHLIIKEGYNQALGQLAVDHFWRTYQSTVDMASINLLNLLLSPNVHKHSQLWNINELTCLLVLHCGIVPAAQNKETRCSAIIRAWLLADSVTRERESSSTRGSCWAEEEYLCHTIQRCEHYAESLGSHD